VVETLFRDAEIGKAQTRTYRIMKDDGTAIAVPRDVFLEKLEEALQLSSTYEVARFERQNGQN